jgi:hypothetical protein
VIKCAICGGWLANVAHQYGNEIGGPVVCFPDWMAYLDWAKVVDAKANELVGRMMADQKTGDLDGAAMLQTDLMLLGAMGLAAYVEPGPGERDVLEEYGLLPAHVTATPMLNPPVGPAVMDPDRRPQHREAGGW